MKNISIPSYLKRPLLGAAFILFSFSFMRGCDPMTSLAFRIENHAASKVELKFYGLTRSYRNEKTDSLKTLDAGDNFVVFWEEQWGKSARPTEKGFIYFVDSIRVTHLEKNITSTRNFTDFEAWVFHGAKNGGEQRLTIEESDF